ncbi:MAG: hydrogenase expression/formation protein HypE [Bacteroidales bacterium]|nr:hydrogenase expression/formation protein HypE [Bacteroidales bacterium]
MNKHAKIELGHGSGGQMTRELINEVFFNNFNNSHLFAEGDSAIVSSVPERIALTTDSYVIRPLFFPGGDIGKLAVAGTVNDLAVAGSIPMYLTAGFILEEGLDRETLVKVVKSMKAEGDRAGIEIIAGDTKVVEKGQADHLYINTAGVGFYPEKGFRSKLPGTMQVGDVIIINGSPGDHEAAIINAREGIFEETKLYSDCASLNGVIETLLRNCSGIKFMRDITRGGLAEILNELVQNKSTGLEINEAAIPCSDAVKAFCEMLGYDILHLASEGKFVIIAEAGSANNILSELKQHEYGKNSSFIGNVTKDHPGDVVLNTVIGGRRLLNSPLGSLVPRIC